jgi:hypothetical protein
VQVQVEHRVTQLTETLAEETKRRERAEQQAGEFGKRRSELETELEQNKQAQASLQQELEASQKQLQAQQQGLSAEQSRLEARTQELQACKAEVKRRINHLTEALVTETRRREWLRNWRWMLSSVDGNWKGNWPRARGEGIAAGDGICRPCNSEKLEAELVQNQQVQAQLQQELEDSQSNCRHNGRAPTLNRRGWSYDHGTVGPPGGRAARVKRLIETWPGDRASQSSRAAGRRDRKRRSDLEAQLDNCAKSWKPRTSNQAPEARRRTEQARGTRRNCNRARRRSSSRSSA